jgi:hypothetical protein
MAAYYLFLALSPAMLFLVWSVNPFLVIRKMIELRAAQDLL